MDDLLGEVSEAACECGRSMPEKPAVITGAS